MNSTLIIGGLGFVGSALLTELVEYKNITVLDNCLSGYLYTKHNFIRGDIRDTHLMQKLIPKYDTIIHLAGIVGAPACSIDEQFAYDINVTATQNITTLLAKDQRFIFISSTSAYGKQANLVTEETELAPLTNYGIHKQLGEVATTSSNANFIILRPATAFGASRKVRVDLLPNTLIYIALTKKVIDLFEPAVIRPFIHVRDFAKIIMHAFSGSMEWNTIYNIGDPNLTVLKQELAQYIADRCGATLVLREGSDPDQRNYDISFNKLLSTGFIFNKNALDLGINDIVTWMPEIQKNYDAFSSPYNTRQFILKEKEYGLFN